MNYSSPTLPKTDFPGWRVAGACSRAAALPTVASLPEVTAGVFSLERVKGEIGGHSRSAMLRKFPRPANNLFPARAFKLGREGRSAWVSPSVSAFFHCDRVRPFASNVVRTWSQASILPAASDPDAKAGGFRVGGKFIHASGQVVRRIGRDD